MVFYIPNTLFPNLSKATRKKLEKEHFFNTIGILDSKENVKTLVNSLLNLDVYKKTNFLKSNFIQLVEFENKLTNEAFKHLIDEYINSAHIYKRIYSWMANHIEKDIPTLEDNYKMLFTYQTEVLNNHIVEIKGRFVINKKNVNVPINLHKLRNFGIKLSTLNEDVKTILKQKTRASKSYATETSKIFLPSDDEVDNMLLSSIFNMDFLKPK